MTPEQRARQEHNAALGGAAMVTAFTVWTGPLCLLFGAGAYFLFRDEERNTTAKLADKQRRLERDMAQDDARVMRQWAADLVRDGFTDDPIVKEWMPHRFAPRHSLAGQPE